MNDSFQYKKGAVTFLDVLGWKGMWQQDTEAAKKLWSIVKATRNKTREIVKEYVYADKYKDRFKEFRGKETQSLDKIVKTISISDTIVLFSKNEAELVIEIHAKICAWLLEHALLQAIPLRGAISYGDYIQHENIMQGPAVDEAASWYEFADWIGVALTPSAHLKVEAKIRNKEIESITSYKDIPYKKKVHHLNSCVDWSFGTNTIEELKEVFLRKVPLTPDIAPKYLNTLEFFMRKQKQDT